jgi:predicted ferric reductase
MLHNPVWSEAWTFVLHYPDMLAAYVGWILLLVAAFSSIRIARRKMRYETWWVVHLYTYLGLGLSFMHQIRVGVMFIGHPLTTQIWVWTWIGAGIVTLLWRIALPVVRNLQFGLRVADITEVAPGVRSITVSGRHLDRLAVNGGQFFQWRFLARNLWWHSHPYSLSALPRPPFLRVTVKGVGDQSAALANLRVGTRVFVEGPYGAFTRHRMTRERVVLIGAGVGITPLRALLEDLPENRPVSVIVRARHHDDVVHGDEMKALVEARHGVYHELIGRRDEVALDGASLNTLAEGLSESDVFVCGPEGFTESVMASLQEVGVPHDRIHFESFTF